MSRTLIIAPCTVADAVMAQPLIALLKRFDPARRIDVLAKPSIAPLFRAVAEVSEVIESSHGFGELQPLAKVGLARRLGARRYERAYVLPHKRRAAIAPWLAGIPQRVGIASRWHWGLINCEHRHAGGAPTAERFARLAFAPDQPLPAIPAPVLMRNRERERALRERLGLSDDAMLIVLCPGGDHGPAQRWPWSPPGHN
ncbi:MAG TPA: lipopolysaccharide heptosyltransferase II, partial [Burkholderiaceae bacterium]|nr:lipopolysaccharide heptosyltransferase II [Burkholderiaceae bacterium]